MQAKFKDQYVAHYGMRTKNLEPMKDWYTRFFDARVQYDLGFGVFMTWDEDHHRLVLWTDEDTTAKAPTAAGVDHVGIGLPGFEALIDSYERLKDQGISPDLCVNHLFSTSFYYHDPDGNEVELTVDNMPSKDECSAFMKSDGMNRLSPPLFGFAFEAADMAARVRSGATLEDLAQIGVN